MVVQCIAIGGVLLHGAGVAFVRCPLHAFSFTSDVVATPPTWCLARLISVLAALLTLGSGVEYVRPRGDGAARPARRPGVARAVRRALLSLFGVGFLPGPSGTWASLVTTAGLLLLTGPGFGPTAVPAARSPSSSGRWSRSRSPAARAARTATATPAGSSPTRSRGRPSRSSWPAPSPAATGGLAAGLAFLGFRGFDIVKPGPIGASQRLPGGVGVLVDDLLAGLAAGGIVAAVRVAGLLG